jgi:2-polyprenyl-3-methyl-5-hydroxy-6-metoxy-1,4-benzoquinol methylase
MNKSPVEKHFDSIADKYDYFKKRNWYYYQNLKKLYRELVLPQQKVLEIGCGTGDLISSVEAQDAFGIDISSEMIRIARKKHSNVNFQTSTIENYKTDMVFDCIFLADVIEHLENVSSAVQSLKPLCHNSTKIIFSYANPFWEPILWILEKLSLKMPEGPHYRIPFHKFKKILSNNDFDPIERGWRLLFPAYIPVFSRLINNYFFHIPILKRFGLLEYIIIKKK